MKQIKTYLFFVLFLSLLPLGCLGNIDHLAWALNDIKSTAIEAVKTDKEKLFESFGAEPDFVALLKQPEQADLVEKLAGKEKVIKVLKQHAVGLADTKTSEIFVKILKTMLDTVSEIVLANDLQNANFFENKALEELKKNFSTHRDFVDLLKDNNYAFAQLLLYKPKTILAIENNLKFVPGEEYSIYKNLIIDLIKDESNDDDLISSALVNADELTARRNAYLKEKLTSEAGKSNPNKKKLINKFYRILTENYLVFKSFIDKISTQEMATMNGLSKDLILWIKKNVYEGKSPKEAQYHIDFIRSLLNSFNPDHQKFIQLIKDNDQFSAELQRLLGSDKILFETTDDKEVDKQKFATALIAGIDYLNANFVHVKRLATDLKLVNEQKEQLNELVRKLADPKKYYESGGSLEDQLYDTLAKISGKAKDKIQQSLAVDTSFDYYDKDGKKTQKKVNLEKLLESSLVDVQGASSVYQAALNKLIGTSDENQRARADFVRFVDVFKKKFTEALGFIKAKDYSKSKDETLYAQLGDAGDEGKFKALLKNNSELRDVLADDLELSKDQNDSVIGNLKSASEVLQILANDTQAPGAVKKLTDWLMTEPIKTIKANVKNKNMLTPSFLEKLDAEFRKKLESGKEPYKTLLNLITINDTLKNELNEEEVLVALQQGSEEQIKNFTTAMEKKDKMTFMLVALKQGKYKEWPFNKNDSDSDSDSDDED
jgi:hypothetical protein